MSTFAFLREFARHPARLGAVIPSSRYLARLVVDTANISDDSVVVELGAGTGPVSTELLRRHPNLALVAFEPTRELAAVLRQRLPNLRVEERYADEHLADVVEQLGLVGVNRVVSGLPWTLWESAQQERILDGIVSVLPADGRFLTYTYVTSQVTPAGARFRATLARYFEDVWTTPVLWANLPPAVVMVGDRPHRPTT